MKKTDPSKCSLCGRELITRDECLENICEVCKLYPKKGKKNGK